MADLREFDVFLSHSCDPNHNHVVAIAQLLRERGLNVWVDEWHFGREGRAFALDMSEYIRRGIRSSLSVILFVEPEFFRKIQQNDGFCRLEYSETLATKPLDRIAIVRTSTDCGLPQDWPALYNFTEMLHDRFVGTSLPEQPLDPVLVNALDDFCRLPTDLALLRANPVWMRNIFNHSVSDDNPVTALYKFERGDPVWDHVYGFFRRWACNILSRRIRILHETANNLVLAEQVLIVPFLNVWKSIYTYSFADGTAALVQSPVDRHRMAIRFQGTKAADPSVQRIDIGIVWYWLLPERDGELLPGQHTEIVQYFRSEHGRLVGEVLHTSTRHFKHIER